MPFAFVDFIKYQSNYLLTREKDPQVSRPNLRHFQINQQFLPVFQVTTLLFKYHLLTKLQFYENLIQKTVSFQCIAQFILFLKMISQTGMGKYLHILQIDQ